MKKTIKVLIFFGVIGVTTTVVPVVTSLARQNNGYSQSGIDNSQKPFFGQNNNKINSLSQDDKNGIVNFKMNLNGIADNLHSVWEDKNWENKNNMTRKSSFDVGLNNLSLDLHFPVNTSYWLQSYKVNEWADYSDLVKCGAISNELPFLTIGVHYSVGFSAVNFNVPNAGLQSMQHSWLSYSSNWATNETNNLGHYSGTEDGKYYQKFAYQKDESSDLSYVTEETDYSLSLTSNTEMTPLCCVDNPNILNVCQIRIVPSTDPSQMYMFEGRLNFKDMSAPNSKLYYHLNTLFTFRIWSICSCGGSAFHTPGDIWTNAILAIDDSYLVSI